MVEIDILVILDRLEAAFNKGFALPFSSKRLVDEDECLDAIEQMRAVVPEEIKQARRMSTERDRLLAQAKEEADRIVALAKEEAARQAEQSQVVRMAQEQSDAIHEHAIEEARGLREDADQYARDVLLELQQRIDELTARLTTLQGTVNNGLSQLTEHQDEQVTSAPPPSREPAKS